jgi:phage terminase Nu1 subunit (DNA packaging protein)
MALEERLSPTKFAQRIGITVQQLQNLVRAGRIVQNGTGRGSWIDWASGLQSWVAYKQEQAESKHLKREASENSPDYDEAHARKEAADAARSELKLAKERGEVVLTRDVRRAAEIVFGNFKARAMSVPAKLARRLGACKTDAQRKDVIEKEMREMLHELVMSAVPGERFKPEPVE